MGPVVNESLGVWQLRPFQTSSTFQNLQSCGVCTFHVTDDVLLVVKSALSIPIDLEYSRSRRGGWIIETACHWYCLETHQWDLSQPRSQVSARLIEQGSIRPFWGWNRAKHAIIEATILATRLELIGRPQALEELNRLESAVHKTAGQRELDAWDLVCQYISQSEQTGG